MTVKPFPPHLSLTFTEATNLAEIFALARAAIAAVSSPCECGTAPALMVTTAAGVGIEQAQDIPVESPFGDPSAAVTTGMIGGVRVTFLPRHGIGHAIPTTG